MRRKNSKALDNVIDRLFSEFAKADLVLNNEELLSFTLKTIKHFAEIQDYKSLFKHYFIPKANKATIDLKKAIWNSKFKKYFKNEFNNLEENKNETVRLGVVGLFHKYEGFRGDLVRNTNQYLRSNSSK